MSKQDFYMKPPLVSLYDKDSLYKEFVHSAKAFHVCGAVAKTFAECRKKPSGKIVHPELCKPHADTLLTCYNEVKTTPKQCEESYIRVVDCLQKGNYKARCD